MDIQIGSYSLTVRLSLAIEAILGKDSGSVRVEDIRPSFNKDTDHLLISLNSIATSCMSALEVDVTRNWIYKNKIDELVEVVDDELAKLHHVLTNNGIKFSFYHNKVKDIKVNNKVQEALEFINKTSNKLQQEYPNIKELKRLDGWVISSTPFDLLINKGMLLEMSTGNVVKPLLFNKKLKSTKKMPMSSIPFNSTTLDVFGDTYGYVTPRSIQERKASYEALVKNKVTPFTKEFKIKQILNKVGK